MMRCLWYRIHTPKCWETMQTLLIQRPPSRGQHRQEQWRLFQWNVARVAKKVVRKSTAGSLRPILRRLFSATEKTGCRPFILPSLHNIPQLTSNVTISYYNLLSWIEFFVIFSSNKYSFFFILKQRSVRMLCSNKKRNEIIEASRTKNYEMDKNKIPLGVYYGGY